MRPFFFWGKCVFAGVLVSLLFPFACFGLTQEVGYWDNGELVPIGSLESSYNRLGDPEGFHTLRAYFILDNPLGISLDDDYDYRWLQVLTEDDPPYAVTADNKQLSTIPFVDPPPGGYLYQLPEGDDHDPFYWNTLTEWPFFHGEGVGTSLTDRPARYTSGNTIFETCVVLYDPDNPNECKLLDNGCFTWGMEITGFRSFVRGAFLDPVPVENSNTDEHAAYLEEALENTGFADWNIIATCPECEGGEDTQTAGGTDGIVVPEIPVSGGGQDTTVVQLDVPAPSEEETGSGTVVSLSPFLSEFSGSGRGAFSSVAQLSPFLSSFSSSTSNTENTATTQGVALRDIQSALFPKQEAGIQTDGADGFEPEGVRVSKAYDPNTALFPGSMFQAQGGDIVKNPIFRLMSGAQ